MLFDSGVGFMPKCEGKLWVDTSALEWVCEDEFRCHDSVVASLKRMNNICTFLEERGNYLRTLGVHKEIHGSYIYHKNVRSGIHLAMAEGRTHYTTKKGTEIFATKRREEFCDYWVKGYKRILVALKDGTKKYSPNRIQILPSYVREYVDSVSDISEVDKEVVVAAVSNGHYSGVLSADYGLISVFNKSVRKFELKGCFFSNPVANNTRMIERRKRVLRAG